MPITIFFSFFQILWRTIIQVQKEVTKKSRVMLVLPQLITLLVTCIQALHRILLLFTFILIIQGCAWATSAVDTAYNPHPNPSPLGLCSKNVDLFYIKDLSQWLLLRVSQRNICLTMSSFFKTWRVDGAE